MFCSIMQEHTEGLYAVLRVPMQLRQSYVLTNRKLLFKVSDIERAKNVSLIIGFVYKQAFPVAYNNVE